MKWFKHMSDASDDEFISFLEEEFGLAGYARWFKLLETIAKQMDKTGKCYAEYSEQKWCYFLKAKRKQLSCFLVACEKQLKINQQVTGNVIRISCSKLLEIKDNYSKDLVVSSKSLPSKEVDVDLEVDVDKKIKHIARKKDLAPHRERFETLWKDYPCKKGKEKAWIKFKNEVSTDQDWDDIQMALVNYKLDVERIRGSTMPDLQWQHGSTWFYQNWRDYVGLSKPEAWHEKFNRERQERLKQEEIQ